MFDIIMDSQVVGHAKVEKKGLYYRISCICIPPDSGMYRVIVSDGSNTKDLGICVPEGDKFSLHSHVPIKYLPGDDLTFTLVPKDNPKLIVPLETDKPFEHLDKLDSAHLLEGEEQLSILIDPAPTPQDCDPSQEYPHIWEQP